MQAGAAGEIAAKVAKERSFLAEASPVEEASGKEEARTARRALRPPPPPQPPVTRQRHTIVCNGMAMLDPADAFKPHPPNKCI